jgi:hypothetical protein
MTNAQSDQSLWPTLLFLAAFLTPIALVAINSIHDEAAVVADAQVEQAVEQQAERESNTLSVSRSTSTIVFVGDANTEYGLKWLRNEAVQCEAKGWQIKTVDLTGMADPKFFIFSGGAWKIHNGHLSLNSLSALVSRTTATQSQSTGPIPSVAPRRAEP